MSVESKSKKRIEIAVEQLCNDYPVLAPIIIRMNMRPDCYCQTLQVNEYGQGIYNPEFIDQYDMTQLKFLLLHEAYHILLRHIPRLKKHESIKSKEDMQDVYKKNPQFMEEWNYAADSVINENLLVSLPAGSAPVDEDGNFNMVTYQTIEQITEIAENDIKVMKTEDIYDAIKAKVDEQKKSSGGGMTINLPLGGGDSNSDSDSDNGQNGSDSQGGSNSNSGQGDQGDPNQQNPDQYQVYVHISEVFEDQDEQVAADNMEQGIAEAQGKIGHGVKAGSNDAQSDIIINTTKMNNINWREILSEFVYVTSGRGVPNRTWRRQSRRYRDIYPITKGRSRKAGTKYFTFAIDVSGSMDEGKIANAVAIIDDYAKENFLSCKYYFFSTKYSNIYDFSNMDEFRKNLRSNYGGGTSLSAALRENDMQDIGDGLVVVGDMEFDEFSKSTVDTLGVPVVFINIDPAIENVNSYYYGGIPKAIKEAYEDSRRYVEIYS